MTKHWLSLLLVVAHLAAGTPPLTAGFNIQTLDVNADVYTINTVTYYTIFLTREFDPEGL